MHLRLVYESQIQSNKYTFSSINLIEYRDSNYDKDLKDKKFVIKYYYYLNRVMVS